MWKPTASACRWCKATVASMTISRFSPALRPSMRGALSEPYSLEPAPNGGRANLGYTGGTALATTSPAQLVQVLSPNGLEKLTAGQQITVNWRSAGTTYPPADYATTVLADSPAAYWRMNEATGTTAADSTGHGLVGTYSGGVTLGTAGSPANSGDTAVQFNGTNGAVTIADNALLRPAQISVEAWVKPDPTISSGFHAIVIKTSNTGWGDGYGLAQYSTPGQINFFINSYSSNYVSTTIPLGQWSHLVGTYDGTTISLYLNGALSRHKSILCGHYEQHAAIDDRQSGQHISLERVDWRGVGLWYGPFTQASSQSLRSPGSLGSVTIDVMQGTNPTPVQTLTTIALDTGSYPWTVPFPLRQQFQVPHHVESAVGTARFVRRLLPDRAVESRLLRLSDWRRRQQRPIYRPAHGERPRTPSGLRQQLTAGGCRSLCGRNVYALQQHRPGLAGKRPHVPGTTLRRPGDSQSRQYGRQRATCSN